MAAPHPSPNLRPLAWLLLAAFGWTTFVWINRLVNLGYDDRDMSFLVVHFVVAGISLAIGAALGWWGWRLLRTSPSRKREFASAPDTDRLGGPGSER